MKLKNQNSKHSYNSKLRSSAALRLDLCFCVFCLTLLPLCLLMALTDTASADSGTDVRKRLPQNSFALAGDPNSGSGRQLWKAWISVAESEKDAKSKDELKRMIEQIRSVDFKPPKPKTKPAIGVEPAPAIEPNQILSEAAVRKEPEIKETEPKLPHGLITEQTLQTLRNLSQHPNKLGNPFELAEILFLSGNPKDAAVFYREALGRSSPDDVTLAQDRAWILFQIGNCLRNDDPPAATKMYGQLITEYPNSPWIDLAKAQGGLISWRQKDEPHKLVAEHKP